VQIGDFRDGRGKRKIRFGSGLRMIQEMEQVGTLYTATRPLKFDYIGVIFGNDLIFDAE